MKRPWVIHPLLFAVYPILALLAYNISWVTPGESVRPMLIGLACGAVLLLAGRLLLKDWQKAGLVATLILLFFFSYGHLYQFLRAAGLGLSLGRHRFLAPVYWGVMLCFVVLVARRRALPTWITPALNLMAAISLAFPLLTFGVFWARSGSRIEAPANRYAQEASTLRLPADKPPDVYYIILDAYARQDVLRQVFNYDNSQFLDRLRQEGFYVVPHGRSNYAQTSLSLASSLNMDYIHDLLPDMDPASVNREPLWNLIQHSEVRRLLEGLGYQTVAFSTSLPGTEITDADLFLTAGSLDEVVGLSGVTPFESMLLDTTAGRMLTDASIALPRFFPDLTYPYRLHRARIRNIFDRLQTLPETPGPKFVFAHVIAPHPPFVFGPQGEEVQYNEAFTLGFTFGDAGSPVSNESYLKGYRDQVAFVDQQVLQAVEAILAKSPSPPIIILQGDHGPEGRHPSVSYVQERMTILNAIYLPDDGRLALYDGLTPVNTFRIILNQAFGGSFPLLPDRVMYSEYRTPYRYHDLTDQIDAP